MKRIGLAVAVLAALAAGQYIERYIPLPDSFGGLITYDEGESWFVEDSASARVFYGVMDGRFLLVLDPSTGNKIGRVELGGKLDVPFGHNPREGKLYCAVDDSSTGVRDLRVFDCATGGLLGRVATGDTSVVCFSYNPTANKVYAQQRWGDLLVIDGAGDSIVARVDVPGWVSYPSMAFSPVRNKLYVACFDTLLVVDGSADTVQARLGLGWRRPVRPVVWNPAADNVWCAADHDHDIGLRVLDCATDSVLLDSTLTYGPIALTEYNPATRRLYLQTGRDVLFVFDCVTRRVDTTMWLPLSPRALAVNPLLERVYLGGEDGVVVLDASTHRSVAITSDIQPFAFAARARGTNVLADGYGILSRIGPGDSVEAKVPLFTEFQPLCYNPADGRLYGSDWVQGQLVAIDGAHAVPAGAWTLSRHEPHVVVCCSLTNRLFVDFFVSFSQIAVFDCAAESTVARLNQPGMLCHDAARHRLYTVSSTDALVAYDCRTLQEVGRTVLPHFPYEAAPDEAGDKLYYRALTNVVGAVDTRGDSLLWSRYLGSTVTALALRGQSNELYALALDSFPFYKVVVLDTRDGSTLASIPLPMRGGDRLVHSATSGRLYVISVDDTLIAVVDCDSRTVRGTVALEGGVRHPVYDASRNRLYVTLYGAFPGAVAVLDCATDSVLVRLVPDRRIAGFIYGPAVFDWQHGRLFSPSGLEGGVTVIRDTTPVGVAEGRKTPDASRSKPEPTIIRGVLNLPVSSLASPLSEQPVIRHSDLLDAAGRFVMPLRAGSNDVSALAPGVYFVRQSTFDNRHSPITKVVVTR